MEQELPGVTQCMLDEARALVEKYYPEKKAWLVGSRVEGTHSSDSDLDVVVETIPLTMKKDGIGRRIKDTKCGIVIDITEDEDGPIFKGEDSQYRI
jgi:predicted nucleotidyltransferase